MLVAGATGGVGNQVVQLAAKAGAQVVATASSETEQALVRHLGAATSIDYTGDVTQAVQQAHPGGVDVVIHLAGDPATLLPAVRTGGRFISTLIGSPEQLPTEEATVIGIYANPDTTTLNRAAAHQVDGVTRLQVQDTFPLDKAPAALAAFTGGTLGKLVITTT